MEKNKEMMFKYADIIIDSFTKINTENIISI